MNKICALAFLVSLCMATYTHAKAPNIVLQKDQQLAVELENTPLNDALQAIEKATGVQVVSVLDENTGANRPISAQGTFKNIDHLIHQITDNNMIFHREENGQKIAVKVVVLPAGMTGLTALSDADIGMTVTQDPETGEFHFEVDPQKILSQQQALE